MSLVIKQIKRKAFPAMIALIHLMASIGFAEIEHHCRKHSHVHSVAERCCCANEHSGEQASCCILVYHGTPDNPGSSGPSFSTPGCCELVSHFNRVEETAPSASAHSPHTLVRAVVLLPAEKNSALEFPVRTLFSLTAPQLRLPLLN